MLQIECPWCGVRDEVEFSFGGESHVTRPSPEVDDAQWADYLFNHSNTKGLQHERWCHSFGCQRWFNVTRDTVTHEIAAVYAMDQQPPLPRKETGT
jgi:sarcosine oxidase, subunit delta